MGRPRAIADETPTPDRIRASAAAVFAEHGFARATLADIADGAGIRRPSLLHHFATKEALYADVVRLAFGRLTEVMTAPMALDAPFEARLEALVRAYAGYFAEHPDHARIVVREMLEADGPGTAILRTEIAPLLDVVLAFLAREGGDAVFPGYGEGGLRSVVMQIAADVMLQNAVGTLGPMMWGERSIERTWQLARRLVLA